MLAAGVEEEVRRASAAGASVTARKALGFEELLAGDVEAIKRRTRNYARRQLTWMRKLAGVHRARRHRPLAGRRGGARSSAAGWRGLSAQKTGTNGYMQHHRGDDARQRPDADQRRSPPAPQRATPRDSEVGDRDVDARHHDHHVVEVAGALIDQAEQRKRDPGAQKPGQADDRQLRSAARSRRRRPLRRRRRSADTR